MPRATQVSRSPSLLLRVQDFHLLRSGFPASFHCITSLALFRNPTTPTLPKQHWFGLLPVRSPLLRKSLLFSSPMGTKMFQFPTFAQMLSASVSCPRTTGCPIRISADQFVCANPRSFSQLITSFIASESQGIRHVPLLTFCLTDHVWSIYTFSF